MSRLTDPEYVAVLESDDGTQAIAAAFGYSRHQVKRDRAELAARPTVDANAVDVDSHVDEDSTEFRMDGSLGKFTNFVSDKPLTDFSDVFRKFDRDPDEFEIVGTVAMKAWQQSAFDKKSQKRSTVTLYSYGARFRKKGAHAISQEDIDALIREARMWSISDKPAPMPGAPVAAVLNLADMQLFKRDGGGFHATMNRLRFALHRFRDHVQEVRARGINLNELIIVNNGDPFEGIAGNYANQAHTVEGGLRAQMNAVLDVWMMFARELYPLFEKRQFVSVLCNHTQFGRQGGAKDSITGEEDNGSAFLAETLQRILHATPCFEDVKFTIPHDEMNVYTTAAGIPMGFNHGHKIPKSDASGFETWLNGQVRADRQAYDVRVWVTAHRHNMQMFDIGNASVLQCPSCDGGSKWLTDTTGKHSNAGVVSILVGEHHRLGWSDMQFL